MSRFDRRLKGGGLRPGQSTCKIRNAPAKVMSSGFGNTQSINGANYATAYNNQRQPIQQVQQQSMVPEVANMKNMTQEQLSKKNRQLEQYALTAPSQEMRTMTMHEIRLNKLEWINGQAELMMESENNPEVEDLNKKIDAKLATYTLTTLEPRLKKVNSSGSKMKSSDDLTVKFKNLNGISMKMQSDISVLKGDVELSKATIKTFGGNLQKVHSLQKEVSNYKKELDIMKGLYRQLKNDFDSYVKNANSKKVELTIEDIEREKKKMNESEVRDVVVKAIKEKSVN